MSEGARIVLDACACINLAAALGGPIGAILGWRPVIVPEVASEAMYLHVVEDGEVTQKSVVKEGLEIVRLSKEECRLFVDLAVQLDDGEAASLALAFSRGWAVGTDDRAARRTASRLSPQVQVVTTATLLRGHTSAAGWDHLRISRAVRLVETHASFRPPKDDIEYEWWISHL